MLGQCSPLTAPNLQVIKDIVDFYRSFPQVQAIVLGRSRATANNDSLSDLDVYIYSSAAIEQPLREGFVFPRARRAEVGCTFWEISDEWDDQAGEVHVDVMFRSPLWIEQHLTDLLDNYSATVGYTTCLWHNVIKSKVFFDRDGWFGELQKRYTIPYPIPHTPYPISQSTGRCSVGQKLPAIA